MEQNLSKTPIKWRASAIVLAICLVLMVVTSVIGHNIQTSGGTVRTEELTFTTDVGATSHAKLYIPETATAETPAPAILLWPSCCATATLPAWMPWNPTPLN